MWSDPTCAAVGARTLFRKGGALYEMDGWDWLWMSVVMTLWAVVVGAVIYAVVRLAQRDR